MSLPENYGAGWENADPVVRHAVQAAAQELARRLPRDEHALVLVWGPRGFTRGATVDLPRLCAVLHEFLKGAES